MGDNFSMAKKRAVSTAPTAFYSDEPIFYFQKWREYRGLTQETLAGIAGGTGSSISQLENGKQGFTDTSLKSLAKALKCHPGELLMRDPTANDLWTAWETSPLLQTLFSRVSEVPDQALVQIIGYVEGVIARYDTTHETATTPDS